MDYRLLGKTGLQVSKLGFGAMRLPLVDEMVRFVPNAKVRIDEELAIAMLHTAFAAGVNFVDTSAFYCQGGSEPLIGKALKGWREKIIVSTKNPDSGQDEKTWWRHLEQSLERMDIGYIDLYHHHGLNWKVFQEDVEPCVAKWMEQALDQGLIRHRGASIHDTPENVKKLLDTGLYEAVIIQYNLLDRQMEEMIAYADEQGVGIITMGSLAKGRLGRDLPVQDIQRLIPDGRWWSEVALQFIWSNPHVSVALSGMMSLQDVKRNLASAEGKSITSEQRQQLLAWADSYPDAKPIACTECGYCTPCPQGVNIPRTFSFYNDAAGMGGWEAARRGYQRWDGWNPGKKPDACIECGECDDKCPQHLPIRDLLCQVHRELS